MMKSLLDTDFYKLTMMQAVFHHYPSAWAKYEFKWRNWPKMNMVASPVELSDTVLEQLTKLCQLQFTEKELQYLETIPFFKVDFIEYLRLFKLNHKYIKNVDVYANGELFITIEGPWLNTILFEVPTLAIVSEAYTERCGVTRWSVQNTGLKKLATKLNWLKDNLHRDENFKLADFGTRRRASYDWHKAVIETLIEYDRKFLAGTSNVYFAMKYGLTPIGTMAHEFIQAHQQLGPRLVDSQAVALQTWANEYRGELGIALSDCLGFNMFLKDFDRYFALLFDGCRHDSGDPHWWADKLIKHYENLRIDPHTKTAVFSDGLTFPTAVELFKKYNNKIKTAFGIGTYLTNDCGFTPPQIVMKLVEMNHKPTAKISDSPGKGMCNDDGFLTYLKQVVDERVHGKW